MEDAAYKAWLADTRTGPTRLLIAADNTTVARLNARHDRITTGEVEPGGIELHNGNHVGLGDHVVTRLNNRRLQYGNRSYVKNAIAGPSSNAGRTAPHHSRTTTATPPPRPGTSSKIPLNSLTPQQPIEPKARPWTPLISSSPTSSPEPLIYVGMTRARDSNHAYIATHQCTSDLHKPHPEQSMRDVLEAILNDPGVEQSAHEVMRQELDNTTRLDRLIPIHEHLCQVDARDRYCAAATSSGLNTSDRAALEASPAYSALVADLRRAEATGLNIKTILHRAVNQASLHGTHDLAAVLHTRVERLTVRSLQRTGRQPAMSAGPVIPAARVSNVTLAAPLRELEAQIIQRADHLAN